jgi:hypothetical protein
MLLSYIWVNTIHTIFICNLNKLTRNHHIQYTKMYLKWSKLKQVLLLYLSFITTDMYYINFYYSPLFCHEWQFSIWVGSFCNVWQKLSATVYLYICQGQLEYRSYIKNCKEVIFQVSEDNRHNYQHVDLIISHMMCSETHTDIFFFILCKIIYN